MALPLKIELTFVLIEQFSELDHGECVCFPSARVGGRIGIVCVNSNVQSLVVLEKISGISCAKSNQKIRTNRYPS
jgi:hypothetical protein